MRDAVRAARALAPAPNGFTAAEFTANGHARTGHEHIGYSLRQATYACANCGANGSTNPAEPAATTLHPWRTIAALLTLREELIDPILAAVRSPAWDTNLRTGHASTATTNESASICKHSSTISPSKPGSPLDDSGTSQPFYITKKSPEVDPQPARWASALAPSSARKTSSARGTGRNPSVSIRWSWSVSPS